MYIHFSSPQAHFSDNCAAVAGHLWIQGVLPAAPGPRVAPALSPGAGEEPREKALGYQGEPVSPFLHSDRLLSLRASATCPWSRRKLCLRSSATKTLQGCSWGNTTSSCLCVSTSSAQSLPPAHGREVLWTDCVSPKFILKP